MLIEKLSNYQVGGQGMSKPRFALINQFSIFISFKFRLLIRSIQIYEFYFLLFQSWLWNIADIINQFSDILKFDNRLSAEDIQTVYAGYEGYHFNGWANRRQFRIIQNTFNSTRLDWQLKNRQRERNVCIFFAFRL